MSHRLLLRHEADYLGLITAVLLLMTDCVTWFHTPCKPQTVSLSFLEQELLSLLPLAYCSNPNCQLLPTAKLLCIQKWLLLEAYPPTPPSLHQTPVSSFLNAQTTMDKLYTLWPSERAETAMRRHRSQYIGGQRIWLQKKKMNQCRGGKVLTFRNVSV